MNEIIKKATYSFTGEIDKLGIIKYSYHFSRPDLVEIKREKIDFRKNIKDPMDFSEERTPTCGPFSVKFYSWDPRAADLRAVFGDTAIYREMIRPNTGVKVFRDNFRVLPYGNQDNDWLGMDARRVRQFEMRISRNQIIGAIGINAKTNLKLLDKTDREGLIDNDEFRDFLSLVKSALTEFEAERYVDRRKLKEMTGRTRDEFTDRAIFSRNMAALSDFIEKQKELDEDTKRKINDLISETRVTLNNLMDEKEEPLLVAASIGITYMMPIHEVRRDLQESLIILQNMHKSKKLSLRKIHSAILHIKQADSTVGGIGKLMQKSSSEETFKLEKAVKDAIELMRYRLKRNSIEYEIDVKQSLIVKGSIRLITILLLNFLDNSIYWLLRNKAQERKIKIITGLFDNAGIIAVSDNGPGFQDDDINILSLPFFTRKPSGMGLGLYIADRIARTNGGKLVLLNKNELQGLYSGANIALMLSKVEG